VAGRSDEVVGGGGRLAKVPRRHLRKTDDDHEADGPHVQIRGHGERSAGLARAAQVQGRQDDHERDRDRHLMAEESRDSGRDVAGARRDRDGDRQDVVDQQGRGDKQTPGTPQVRGHDLVVTTARRVGVHRLTVRRDHDREHDRDDDAHPHGGRAGRSESISARLRRSRSILRLRGRRLRRISARRDVDTRGHRTLIVSRSIRVRGNRSGIAIGGSGRRDRRVAITVRGSGRRDRRVAITVRGSGGVSRRSGRSGCLIGFLTHRRVAITIGDGRNLIRRSLLFRR